jgi:serine/threonine-protein kinase
VYPDRLGVCPRCALTGSLEAVRLGSFVLEEPLGRGAMGTVYRAVDERLGRAVALKMLPEAPAADASLQRRLQQEARILAQLDHPHIVAVHELGEAEGQHYLAMELVEGGSLAERLPLPARQAVAVARQLCDALGYAHRRGVVHRDLKPSNVLFTPAGDVKVADFGIARVLAEDASLTRTGVAVGTPAYMAPEALGGAPPDPRVDVYALGAVLYEMITGAPPQGAFPPLSPPLDRIVRRALAPSPADRYASADAMAADLAALSGGDERADALAGDELGWVRAVALLLTLATCVGLWAALVSLTPRVLGADALVPLVMLGARRLPDGRLFSLARFETGPTLLAVACVVVAVGGYAMLRRHWRLSGLARAEEGGRLDGRLRVFACGLVVNAMFLFRLLLESHGQGWARTYLPIAGGLVEIGVVYLAWRTVLDAWRTGRPLRREPLLFVGLALAVLPPFLQLWRHVAAAGPQP